jgi:photosystem II stability/assembly factor-like uncharacterized protein
MTRERFELSRWFLDLQNMKKFLTITGLVFILAAQSDVSHAQWREAGSPAGPAYGGVQCFASSGSNIFASSELGIYRSTDNGTSWVLASTPIYANVLTANGTNLFAGIDNSGVMISKDSGTSWTTINAGMKNITINAIAVSGTKLFAGGIGGVFFSLDSGISWTKVNNNIGDTSIEAMLVEGTNLFVGTEGGGVFRSTDNGLNWKSVGLSEEVVLTLAAIGPSLFAGSLKSGVFRSTDSGTSWIPINKGLSPDNNNKYIWIKSFAVLGSNLFVGVLGSSGGVFLLSKDGTNWRSENTPGIMDSNHVMALGISNTNLFAGGDGNEGIWSRPLSDMIGNSVVAELPATIPQIQSFPNPFSQSTSIKFSSSDHSFAQVSIHNLLGSEVARLFTGSLDAGEHVFSWDAQSMPTGMYVCIVRSNGRTEMLPMMLVK